VLKGLILNEKKKYNTHVFFSADIEDSAKPTVFAGENDDGQQILRVS
jgi:hypothetical protein